MRSPGSRVPRPVPIGPYSRPKAHSVHIWQQWRHPIEAAVSEHEGAERSPRNVQGRSAQPSIGAPCGVRGFARSPAGSHSAKMSARRSVSRVLSRRASRRIGDGHPSGAAGRPTAHAADPRAGQRTSPPRTVTRPRVAPSYLALLRVEFARFTPACGSHRRPASSLWHWSSPHGGRALPATLRCGARTFLTPPAGLPPPVTRDHPTASLTREVYPPAGGPTGSQDPAAGRLSRRGGGPLTSAHQHGHDRSPDWPARPRRS